MEKTKELKGLQKNVSLSKYATFKIGGKTKYYFEAKNKKDLVFILDWAKQKKLPFFILGNGSNLLVSDRGFNGLVIKILNTKYKILNTKIVAGAGMQMGKLLNITSRFNLTGLEWSAGIPGTLGGAVFGNAGAFKKSIKNSIESVEVFDSLKNKFSHFKNKDCKFGYRESIFKNRENLIIFSVKLKLEAGQKEEIKEAVKKNLLFKKDRQPLGFPSAGSIFKNPKDSGFSAGELIGKCNLGGKIAGGAAISEKHSNFIVNLGNASAKDVIHLVKLAKKCVKNKFGIKLEEEIQYLGF